MGWECDPCGSYVGDAQCVIQRLVGFLDGAQLAIGVEYRHTPAPEADKMHYPVCVLTG